MLSSVQPRSQALPGNEVALCSQPRTQGLPARFFKYGRQSGRGPGKRWSRVRQILQDSWSISLRAGFMEIKTGGRRKVHEYYLYSFIFCCNLSF